ncbi:MAG: HipA N-terminal domain-containing protein [bacterium]
MKKNRKGIVYFKDAEVGVIEEREDGYRFTYSDEYLKNGIPISVNFPLTKRTYESKRLFVFFKTLLPEGWYRDITGSMLKLDKDDDFGFLVKTCKNAIGAVSVKEME